MVKASIKRGKPAARAKPLQEIPGEATRRRIMDAAEQLFAERGFGAVSLREIVLQAGANVAAAHYHFGSKDELIHQVFTRRAKPVLAQTEQLIAEAQRFVGAPDYLERVIAAIITPSIRGRSSGDDGVRIFNHLRAHLFVESRQATEAVYLEPASHMLAALRLALPGMSANELAWKLHIIFSTLTATTTWVGRILPALSGTYRPDDPGEALAYLVPLFAMLLRASPPFETK
jgi:AcrR family transcriptional regulator